MAKKTVTEKVISDYFRKRDQFDSKRYISRKSFETDLRRAVERNRYLFITGESGSGKTWLVQYYFSNNKTKTNYINLSEVAMAGGLMNYLKSTKPIKKTEEEITTKAGITKFIELRAEAKLKREFCDIENIYLWEFLNENRNHIIVLDNFESVITEPNILNEISWLITLADDPRVTVYDPKFLIIGAVEDVVKYFQKMPNYQTLSNRIGIINITGFSFEETKMFIETGLSFCDFVLSSDNDLTKKI